MFPTFFRFFTDASFFQANVGLVAGIIICAFFIIGMGLAEANSCRALAETYGDKL